MDYSALPNDPDHPAGTSPWSTSPQRPTFSPSDVPTSPLPPQQPQSPYGPDLTDEPGQIFASTQDTLISRAGTYPPRTGGSESTQTSEDSPSSPDLSARLQSPRFGEPDFPSHTTRTSQYAQFPQQQQRRSEAPGRYHNVNKQQLRQNIPQYKLQAKITGLERTGRKDPILRFDVHTNLPKFRTTQFRDVRRTHSEFIKLADHLISSNPEAFVPAVPPPITAAGAGTDEDEARIKASMQRWLNYVCSNEVLIRDDEMIFFVESDFGYSPVHRMKQPATGVRRKVLKQFAPPPDDTPELHEARPVVKLFYLGTMETGQKVDRVVKARRGLGLAESDLGVKLGQMSVQEIHPGLANAYRKLGKIIQTTGDFHAAQGTAEAATFADPLNYHSSDAFIVKETLTNRHILLRELLQAQTATRSKLSAADRLRASSSVRREKVDEAISALDEARSHETYLTQKTQRVTANLLQEKRRWFERTTNDLRGSIREYTLREIEAERRTLATLESVRADIRAIDASGGLSRLGREAHPTVRRSSLASSQGPRGDAWSGVPRRQDALNRSATGSFVPPVPEDNEVNSNGDKGRARALSKTSLGGKDEEDDDRVDAKNAASRLAASTF
ncbi:MAG: Vacuolar protein sorting-associated protein 17 [Cirrosporium novae-zelandiae]|nr:MAG: Vacuolar protein sorting-associated protein 17 [Cirrosporium novae-zelandiae]